MDRDFLIKLVLGVYRVSDLFPEKEPLKFSLREKANQILAETIWIFLENPKKISPHQALKDIEILQGYFEVASAQNWVNKVNFEVLTKEYQKLKEVLLKKTQPEKRNGKEKEEFLDKVRSERVRKILALLKEKEKAQIWEFKKVFPQVSKRTLRRDFEYLLGKGFVERIGEGKNTFYRPKLE